MDGSLLPWRTRCWPTTESLSFDADSPPTRTKPHAVAAATRLPGRDQGRRSAHRAQERRRGGILDIGNQQRVREAYSSIARGVGAAQPVVLSSRWRRPGVELVAGVVHDHDFGSLIMLGLGGIHTDLLDDRSFRLLPLLDADAATMWHSLKTAPLLTGYRGSPAANTAAVEDLMLRIGRLAEDHPEVADSTSTR